MKEVIKQISDSFIQEALSSPRMLEDLAAMEKYMSESYDGRTFIELLQNADDAQSTKVKVYSVNDTLVVANNGRPFNSDDIMAICRSGSSNKQRGNSIGYRGVGFKSATTISSEIVIYSADAYFTFSKQLCAKTLGKTPDRVPTVRIPFPYDNRGLSSALLETIEYAESDGFTTFFIFLHADIRKFVSEIEGFNSGWLLFLNSVSNVNIDLPGAKESCRVVRKKNADDDTLVKIIGKKEQWYLVTEGKVSLAFLYDDDRGIIPCGNNEALFHCFLPTLDKTGFPFKVNADFSTDPSRKHLIQDDLTKQALDRICYLYASFVRRAITGGNSKLTPVAALLNNHLSLSELSSALEQGVLKNMRTQEWVRLNDGRTTVPENVFLFPNWLTFEEQQTLAEQKSSLTQNSPDFQILTTVEKLDKLLLKLGAKEVPLKEIVSTLKDVNMTSKLDQSLHGKLFAYSCRNLISSPDAISDVYVPVEGGQYVQLGELSNTTSLASAFADTVSSLWNTKEKNDICEAFPSLSTCFSTKTKSSSGKKQIVLTKSGDGKKAALAINKWKSPIQNCIAVEAMNGWNAKDMSRKSDRFSVQSDSAGGETRFITVKKVDILGDSFKLSEMEYLAAEQFGENYEIFVIATEGSEIEYMYIKNPVSSLSLEKVVKEWEWCCDNYEVTRAKPEVEELALDTHFLKTMSLDYFTAQQTQFLKMVAKEGFLSMEPKQNILVNQINSIVDFYTGSTLLLVENEVVRVNANKLVSLRKLLG